MDETLYRSAFHADAAALLAAARLKTDPPAPEVPSCPGWNVTDLVLHLGGVHRHVTRIIRDRQRELIRCRSMTSAGSGWSSRTCTG
jgi:hypothetical protein